MYWGALWEYMEIRGNFRSSRGNVGEERSLALSLEHLVFGCYRERKDIG